ncbi:MAG: lipoyl(octanoyl) transferase LipB [Muribaculaceae bacterium]|nr:lipoyl(octanoyl) transferase LipB [Muribaculaceae bacterium]
MEHITTDWNNLECVFLGHADYRKVLQMQHNIFDNIVELKRNHIETTGSELILMVEHNDVLTLGKHGKDANLLVSEESLRAQGIECIRIERGGDITYHGPGQLVVYPVINLERYGLGVKAYVNLLEEAVIRYLEIHGIKGKRIEGASGVWIESADKVDRKICALGIKCSRFVSMHGFALNVTTDLSAFNRINPCGFTDRGVTSIQKETGKSLSLESVAKDIAAILGELLGVPIVFVNKSDKFQI